VSWIKKSEYRKYVAALDSYLKELGAAKQHYQNHPWANGSVFVGLVTFPSGLVLQTWPGKTYPSLHLWGEMDLPFYGFESACKGAEFSAECCGYLARPIRKEQTIEVWGHDSWEHHLVCFRDDRIVDVTLGERRKACPTSASA